MNKSKVKAPILLRITLAFFMLVFVISVTSFLYFKFYFRNDVSVPSYIRFLSDTMRGSMGYVYYIIIPAVIVLALIIGTVFENCKERLLCELENTIPQENDDKMKKTPFQDVVCKNDDSLKSHNLVHEVVTQTLKSPIVSQKKSPCVHKSLYDEKPKVKVDASQQFAPKYILQNDISSISELKKIIASEKLPQVSICTDGDLSKLSDEVKEQVQKINSLDTNKIFAQIKQKNLQLSSRIRNGKSKPNYTYRVVSKNSKLPKEKVSECKKATETVELKYLTADEIIAQYRKDAQNKKSTTEFVSVIFEDDKKALDDMAKFYYESHIEEYTVRN